MMAKGASLKFQSYAETVPKLLEILNLQQELKKYDKIVLKPYLTNPPENSTPAAFTEEVIKFCMENKNPVSEVIIAEGADGYDTTELFDSQGYGKLAEKYGVSLIDLNNTETDELENSNFMKFESIHYPKILWDSFIISLPKLTGNEETDLSGSLANMLGAYPGNHYSGFFSSTKSKIRKWPIKYSIYDMARCKLPNFSIVDASNEGAILAGLPLEIDKQSAKILGKDWRNVPHLKLIDSEFPQKEE